MRRTFLILISVLAGILVLVPVVLGVRAILWMGDENSDNLLLLGSLAAIGAICLLVLILCLKNAPRR